MFSLVILDFWNCNNLWFNFIWILSRWILIFNFPAFGNNDITTIKFSVLLFIYLIK